MDIKRIIDRCMISARIENSYMYRSIIMLICGIAGSVHAVLCQRHNFNTLDSTIMQIMMIGDTYRKVSRIVKTSSDANKYKIKVMMYIEV